MPYFGQKCVNLLKIWIYDAFMMFLFIFKFLKFFAYFWPIFCQKTCVFINFAPDIEKKNFTGKMQRLLGKWPNWPNNWYKCSLILQEEDSVWVFRFFRFLSFYRTRKLSNKHFWVKIGNFPPFLPKKCQFDNFRML